MPGPDPAGVVRPTHGEVGVAQDRSGLVQYVLGGEPASLPVAVAQSSGTFEVGALTSALQVVAAVVLVERLGAHEPEVSAAEEAAVGVGDDVLRLDLDVADAVEDAQEGLPGGLRPGVRPAQGALQALRAPAP